MLGSIVIVLTLLLTLLIIVCNASSKFGPSAWLITADYYPGMSSNCGTSGPVQGWTASSVGLCTYNGRIYSTQIISGLTVTIQNYGSDSTCSTPVGPAQTRQIPPEQLTCQKKGLSETISSIPPAAYTSVKPYGLPRAPFVGVGFVATLSTDCTDYSLITQISLANALTVPFCYSAYFRLGGPNPTTSYTVSCANPEVPQFIYFPNSGDCTGKSEAMTSANAPSIYPGLTNPTCQSKPGASILPVFCVDTAVPTNERLHFPTPLPTRPPTPTTMPTLNPTAVPSQTLAPTQTALKSDTAVLCALYLSMDPSKRAKLKNWSLGCENAGTATACNPLMASSPYSSWTGVTCQKVHFCDDVTCNLDGKFRVVSLSLSASSVGGALKGQLPVTIGNMNGLTSLQLTGLSLTENLPTQLGSLLQLSVLDLSGNNIRGKIPSQLGLLSKELKSLKLQSNSLTGPLPSQLAKLSGLTALNVASNSLIGGLGAWLGNDLTSLALLDLSNNNFNGAIPTSLCSLSGGPGSRPKSATVGISNNAKLECYPSCFSSSSSSFGHDSSQVQCAPPSERPTQSPTFAPGSKQKESTNSNVDEATPKSSLSTGGVVGVSFALIILCVGSLFVYRMVRQSEIDLPSSDAEEGKAIYGSNNPMSDYSFGRKDSIPPPTSFYSQSSGRKDSIPIAIDNAAVGGRRSSTNSTPPASGRRDSIPTAMVNDAESRSGRIGRLNPNSNSEF